MKTLYLTHYSDAFALFYNAKTKKVQALNGSGRSPKALNVQKLQERGITGRSIPLMDLNSVTVPGIYPYLIRLVITTSTGAAAAWVDSVELFGSGSVSFADVAAPAIQLADQGVPVSEIHSMTVSRLPCVSSYLTFGSGNYQRN